MNKTPDLSLVIACYNEAGHIKESFPLLTSVLDRTGLSYELIIIDDCSQDGTAGILRGMFHADDHVTLKVNKKNIGRGGTVADGFRLAKGHWVGYLDIDLEIGPWYLFPALEKLRSGKVDGVIAHRIFKIDAHPTVLIRQWMSIGFRKLSHAMLNLSLTDVAGSFKFFDRKKILPVVDMCESRHWFWDTELVYQAARTGLKIDEIPVLFLRRPEKKSTVRPVPDTLRQVSEILGLLWRNNRTLSENENDQ